MIGFQYCRAYELTMPLFDSHCAYIGKDMCVLTPAEEVFMGPSP